MIGQGHRASAIAEAVGGKPVGNWMVDPRIDHLTIDSRKTVPGGGSLFVALEGDRHDGHRYIPELIERGVRCFIVARSPAAELVDRAAFIVVADTRDALQRLAAWHRSHFHVPVVGITGSNGKTVVKEWLFHLLHGNEHIVRSPGSWNSQVGVPLSVWEMHAGHTLALFEAGISKPGEMERLRAIIRPTVGVLTNIGPAHGENFKDDLAKALEKVKLFDHADALVYCADHAAVNEALDRTALDQRLLLRGWSREKSAWLHVMHEEALSHGTRITVISDARQFAFEIPFTDQASIENALHCVTLLLHLGKTPEWIAERTPHLPPVSMRLEVVEGVHSSTLINDAYSNDRASLAIALEHLGTIAAGRRKVVVLSDLLESGESAEVLYRAVAGMLQRNAIDVTVLVGPDIGAHKHLFSASVQAFRTTKELIEQFDPALLRDTVVLVKGARAFALEQVVARWQRKVHGTVLEIDLEAIRHNLNHYRALLAPRVRTMAMVKAFGYGTGALELSRLFAHEQVNYLGVAYADEGIELRQNGITLPILVMNPEPVPVETLHRFQLEAEVYDERSLQEAIYFARQRADAPPLHIKLDTGMHRLGFTEHDLPGLLKMLGGEPPVRIASIFSHLVASEDPSQDDFTRQQIEDFSRMADAVTAVLDYRPMRHIANSAGASRWPSAHFDMVRLGIGLHGIGVNAGETDQLRSAAALRTVIAQIKQLRTGATVGYGRKHIVTGDRTIATLPIGYADGFSRSLSNGKGRVWVHGKPASIVGTVCMDMCMVDVTDIPCAVGDPVVLFDAAHPITELAQAMGTISYEVLTSIAQRVKRVYVQG